MARDLTLLRRTPHAALGIGLLAVCTLASRAPQSPEILLATTTSTRDAGLLDSLLPIFERRSGFKVKVVAVGSGQALEMGRRGDADVVLAHAPEAERVLVDLGYFVRRRLVMHNDFLVVGPAVDPAAVRGMTDAVAAVGRIAARQALFVSRGDRSGTHLLELKLWRLASSPPDPLSVSGEGGGDGRGTSSPARGWRRRSRWPTRSGPTPSPTAPPTSPGATRCSSCPSSRATRCCTTCIT